MQIVTTVRTWLWVTTFLLAGGTFGALYLTRHEKPACHETAVKMEKGDQVECDPGARLEIVGNIEEVAKCLCRPTPAPVPLAIPARGLTFDGTTGIITSSGAITVIH